MPLDRDDLPGELAFHGGLVGQLVRAQAQLVLLLAADAVQQGQVLCGHAHHAGGLGHVQAHARVRVDLVHHRQVAEVFHAAHQVDVAHARHDIGGSGVQRRHGGAAQAVHGLAGNGERQLGGQDQGAAQVHALLASAAARSPRSGRRLRPDPAPGCAPAGP